MKRTTQRRRKEKWKILNFLFNLLLHVCCLGTTKQNYERFPVVSKFIILIISLNEHRERSNWNDEFCQQLWGWHNVIIPTEFASFTLHLLYALENISNFYPLLFLKTQNKSLQPWIKIQTEDMTTISARSLKHSKNFCRLQILFLNF